MERGMSGGRQLRSAVGAGYFLKQGLIGIVLLLWLFTKNRLEIMETLAVRALRASRKSVNHEFQEQMGSCSRVR
jgi:hypothetical protein